MGDTTTQAGAVAAAAVVLGGLLAMALPQHAPTFAALVVATAAAGAGLHLLGARAPTAWWRTPFDRGLRLAERPRGVHETDWIAAGMGGRRQEVGAGTSLPPLILRQLRPVLQAAVARTGLDATDPGDRQVLLAMLSPLAWAVFTTEPLDRPPWWRLRRPDRRRTAAAAHGILDEVDALAGVGRTPPPEHGSA